MEDNMHEDSVGPIQRYYYEDMMCRRDKEVEKWHKAWKTTFIALIVTFLLLVGCVAGFAWYESSFEDLIITQENSDGVNNYVGNDGSIYNYPLQNDEQ